MGGKSAAVVLDDYDVGQAAQHLAMVTPVMSGQVCAALTRVIVPRNRHDQLVDALSSALSAIKVGDPFDQTTGMGPLGISPARDQIGRASCGRRGCQYVLTSVVALSVKKKK